MKGKRILAYIIDIIIATLIAELIMYLPPLKPSLENYLSKSQDYIETIFKSTTGSADIDEENLIKLSYDVQKASQNLNIITAGVLFIYFGIFAYINHGRTLGKMIFKLKVAPLNGDYINPGLFILRTILVTNLIPKIGLILLTGFCGVNTWSTYFSIINDASYFLILLILGFVVFRDDERGLHDLISQTKVISTKDNKVGE